MGARLTTAYLLGGDLVSENRTTVGFTLLTLALNAGAAAGYATGAQIAAHGSAAEGFLLRAGAAIVAALGAAGLSRALRRVNDTTCSPCAGGSPAHAGRREIYGNDFLGQFKHCG